MQFSRVTQIWNDAAALHPQCPPPFGVPLIPHPHTAHTFGRCDVCVCIAMPSFITGIRWRYAVLRHACAAAVPCAHVDQFGIDRHALLA